MRKQDRVATHAKLTARMVLVVAVAASCAATSGCSGDTDSLARPPTPPTNRPDATAARDVPVLDTGVGLPAMDAGMVEEDAAESAADAEPAFDADETPDAKPSPVCEPGEAQKCVCPKLGMGMRSCRDDGLDWNECVCKTPSDAGFANPDAEETPDAPPAPDAMVVPDAAAPDAAQPPPDAGSTQPDVGAPDTGPTCAMLNCDDRNPCTIDRCDPQRNACTHDPDPQDPLCVPCNNDADCRAHLGWCVPWNGTGRRQPAEVLRFQSCVARRCLGWPSVCTTVSCVGGEGSGTNVRAACAPCARRSDCVYPSDYCLPSLTTECVQPVGGCPIFGWSMEAGIRIQGFDYWGQPMTPVVGSAMSEAAPDGWCGAIAVGTNAVTPPNPNQCLTIFATSAWATQPHTQGQLACWWDKGP